MRTFFGILFVSAIGFAAVIAVAQPPAGERREPPRRSANGDAPVDRLLAFDKNKDGQLSKDELTDERLQALFERADENKDETLTKIELVAFFDKELAQAGGQGGGSGGDQRGGPGAGGPGGPGGGRGPGGPPPGGGGGRGPGVPGQGGAQGFGGGPQQGQQMGQMSPMMMLDSLNLSEQQRKQVQDLQREFDARIEKILTADQKKQLSDLRARGVGGAGGGGPGGGGPGGGGGAGGQGAGPGGQGGGAPGGGGPGNAGPGGRGPADGARPGAKKN